MNESGADTASFWDEVYRGKETLPPDDSVERARECFGEVSGKRLLELGCGNGVNALYWAEQGAEVVAIDISEVAVEGLKAKAAERGLANVTALKLDAFALTEDPPFDLVYGKMILHHLEPFADFAAKLDRMMAPGGRGFFYENSAMSRLLVWARTNIVGRLWVPKHGDDDESPLEPGEIDCLRAHFAVRQEYPFLLFFRLISWYLLGGRLQGLTGGLDKLCYRLPFMRRLSYRQYVLIEKRPSGT